MDRPIRLFDTETQQFTDGSHPYAILSHRWVKNEPTFRQVHRHQYLPPATSKFKRFCDVAGEQYRCRYVWVDSICINKHDKKELDSSIQSMFLWYQNAEICIVYLQDASDLNGIWSSAWFTRGWTLQELLAPKKIAFFFSDWTRILPKSDVDIDRAQPGLIRTGTEFAFHKKVARAAGIPESTIASTYIPNPRNLERVLKWAEKRETTVPEDTAYSLVSLLGVCLPPRYKIGSAAALSGLKHACDDACLTQLSSKSFRFSIESTSGDKDLLCEQHRISSGAPVIVRMSSQGDALKLLKVLPDRHLVFTSPPGLLRPSRSVNKQYAIYKELNHNTKSSRADGLNGVMSAVAMKELVDMLGNNR
ncbi:hypothetical protein ONZ45_g12154 [Pleurotus djamor]|nr:hypothetical protein ONZ45_g12154 [Pleurotus djamor]